jgi:hypothetical protein
MSTEVYYRKLGENDPVKITPSPLISIDPEFYYANDNIIGYTYNVTLNGYASALESAEESDNSGIDKVISSINTIKQIFNANGGDLEIYLVQSGQESKQILSAKGASIKSISFNASENYWINYSQYTITLEFNELDLNGCDQTADITCSQNLLSVHNIKYTSNLIDLSKYKIKEFSDNWSFSIDDNVHQDFDNAHYNSTINVTYTLSATGKNYYPVTSNVGTITPAWEQAQMFVQDRLYEQLNAGFSEILSIGSNLNTACSGSSPKISELYSFISDAGLLKDLYFENSSGTLKIDGGYKIYNEMISCETSESGGSFAITYTCLLKRHNPNLHPRYNSVLHKYTKSLSVNNDQQYNHTITINGNVQGLIEGSIIDNRSANYFPSNSDLGRFYKLPKNGSFFTALFTSNTKTKYENAKDFFYDIIGNDSDLNNTTKQKLGVTFAELAVGNINSGYPVSSNFTLNHSYSNGIVEYTAEYNSNNAIGLQTGYTNVNIVRNDPVAVVQEFSVPGRTAGPIIQNIGAKTPKSISISINGANYSDKLCINDLSAINICTLAPTLTNITGLAAILNNTNNNWIRTKKDFTVNPIDGSFSINLEYICTAHMN